MSDSTNQGHTSLDKVYAASDILTEARRGLPPNAAKAEFRAAVAALRKLETAVEKVEKAEKTSKG